MLEYVVLSMYLFAALTVALDKAINDIHSGRSMNVWQIRGCVENLYTWHDVAKRTEYVYDTSWDAEDFSLQSQLSG
jgi:hypothetical protein